MGESEKQLENDEERNMATIKDIAAPAGVTATTVSRVINNRGYISEETRKKVTQAMQEMNYQPNELARSLAKAHSNTIGVIVPHISHPFFSKMISALESAAAKRGYKILLCNSKDQPEKETEYLDMFISNRVTGVVMASQLQRAGRSACSIASCGLRLPPSASFRRNRRKRYAGGPACGWIPACLPGAGD